MTSIKRLPYTRRIKKVRSDGVVQTYWIGKKPKRKSKRKSKTFVINPYIPPYLRGRKKNKQTGKSNHKIKKYTLYEDPGHAWVKVQKQELEELGIANKISRYSYMRGNYAYLEEDSDFPKFFNALEKKHKTKIDIDKLLRTQSTTKNSKIRTYSSYKAYSKNEKKQLEDLITCNLYK